VALAVSGVTREKNKVNLNTTAATAVSPADDETVRVSALPGGSDPW
jgi:hypothetical protein